MVGFILKTIDYQDHSKLLYLYTEEGLKSMLARGVKKMNSPWRHLAQANNLIEVSLSKAKLPTVKEAKLLDYYPLIKADIYKQTTLQVIGEYLYYNLTEDDDHAKLFGFLKKLTHALSNQSQTLEILALFELKFLHFLGYSPGLRRCLKCEEKTQVNYDINSGSLVCPKHQPKQPNFIQKDIYKAMQTLYLCDINHYQPLNLNKQDVKKLTEVTTTLFSMHLGFISKAKKVLMSLYFGG